MIPGFSTKLAESLAGMWTTRVLGPAGVYWLGVLLAWAWKHDWRSLRSAIQQVEPIIGLAMVIGALVLISVSTILMEWATLPILQLAEGYWPKPLWQLEQWMVYKLNKRLDKKRDRLDGLKKQANKLDAWACHEKALLEAALARYPVNDDGRLPTRLGNLLRAAEEHSRYRYGLEISVIWPRLWLLLPGHVREELSAARRTLDERIQMMAWGVLFVVWSIWTVWALPAGMLVFGLAYLSALSAAGVYGDLLRSAVDLHRFALYEALRLEPPSDEDECTRGMAVTEYLFRGEASQKGSLPRTGLRGVDRSNGSSP